MNKSLIVIPSLNEFNKFIDESLVLFSFFSYLKINQSISKYFSTPIDIQKSESPDFIINKQHGIEISIAIPTSIQYARSIAEKTKEENFIELDKKLVKSNNLTRKNIDKFIKPIDQEITGDPWFGDSIEKEWAKRVCEIIENKTIKLNNRYKIFKMNILLVNGDFLLTRDISSSYKYLKQYIKEKDFNNNFKINFTEIFIVNKLKKMIFYKTK